MQKCSNEVKYFLMGLLLALNLSIRLPVVRHEIGVDSILIHALANSINGMGHIQWALHPLSLIGIAPISYACGSPLLLSISSQLTGVNIEYVILIYALILSILGVCGSYFMAMRLKSDYRFAFLTAFAFSMAPIFINITYWTASTRNLFVALLPLFLGIMFWCIKEKTRINEKLITGALFLVTLTLSHSMFILLVIILFSFGFAKFIYHLANIFYITRHKLMQDINIRIFLVLTIFLIFYSIQFSNIAFWKGIWFWATGSYNVSISSIFNLSFKLAWEYARNWGPLIIFGLIGYAAILREKTLEINKFCILCILLFSAPILAQVIYMPLFLLSISSIFISFGMCYLLDRYTEHITRFRAHDGMNFLEKLPSIFIFTCLLASIFFSIYENQFIYNPLDGTSNKRWMTEDTVELASFLNKEGARVFLTDDYLTGMRVYTLAGIPFLAGDFVALFNGWLKQEDVDISEQSLVPYNVIAKPRLTLANKPQIDQDLEVIKSQDPYSVKYKNILKKYNIEFYVTSHKLPANRLEIGHSYIYDNGREGVLYL